jgi:hypothetical protein
LTREDCIVVTAYGFFAAVSAGFFFHKVSAFLMVGWLLAYVLKMVLSLPHEHVHTHGLTAAVPVPQPNAVSDMVGSIRKQGGSGGNARFITD